MRFSIKLFTIQGDLSFMNNFSHKLAVVSVCATLSLILGGNKEAKAINFTIEGNSSTGIGESIFNSFVSVQRTQNSLIERRYFSELDLTGFSIPPGTRASATFQTSIQYAGPISPDFYLDLFGYVGNGTADLSDFNAGIRLGTERPLFAGPNSRFANVSFDVSQFVNERISNRDNFGGFGIRVHNSSSFLSYGSGYIPATSLTVSTEPVPEPATILATAVALGWGGWLKRKNSSKQNKTKS
jgi:hypothetical protein